MMEPRREKKVYGGLSVWSRAGRVAAVAALVLLAGCIYNRQDQHAQPQGEVKAMKAINRAAPDLPPETKKALVDALADEGFFKQQATSTNVIGVSPDVSLTPQPQDRPQQRP